MSKCVTSFPSKGWRGPFALGCSLAISIVSAPSFAEAQDELTDATTGEDDGSPDLAEASEDAEEVPAGGSDDAEEVPAGGSEESSSDPDGFDESVDEGGDEDEGLDVSEGGGLFESSTSGSVDDDSATLDGASTSSDSFELGGYIRSDIFIGKAANVNRADIQAAYGEASLQITARKSHWGDAFADLRLRYGKQGNEDRLFVDLREAYVNGYFGPVELRLGKQIVAWGRADAFNPTSNISPVDFRIRSPIEDDRRVGTVGARAFLNIAPFRLEGVWMPLFTPTEYPPIKEELPTIFNEPNFPAATFDDGLYAGRLHLELPAFETSVSYLFGNALFPGFMMTDYDVGPAANIQVSRTSYKHHVVGFDFSTAFGDVLALRGEAAYRRPVDYEGVYYVPRPDLQYVVGIDRAFGNVSVIAQYLGRYTFDWEYADPGTDTVERLRGLDPEYKGLVENGVIRAVASRNQAVFSQIKEMQHLASLRLEWLTLHETLSLSALGLVNVSTKEWFVFPKVSYQITDGMTAYLGGEIYSGPDNTLFDFIETSLTSVYTELRLSF